MADLGLASEPLRLSLARYFRRHIPDVTEVDDLVQEVFTRIVSRDSAEPVKDLTAYAISTAASVLKDRARRRMTRQADAHVAFEPDRHSGLDFAPDQIVAAKEDLRIVTRVLLALPERTRTILILHRLEGLRQKEIALRLGISVSAVEKHLIRALKQLSAGFGDEP